MIIRELDYTASIDGSIEDNLKRSGFSTRICVALRKEMGLLSVGGVARSIVYKVRKGEIIHVILKEEVSPIIKYDFQVDIVYEDDDIAVINKSPDIAVISTSAHYGKSLMNALANVWGDFVYHPINRLDKGTSGLMAIAKNCLTHSIVSSQLNSDNEFGKVILREYLALVHGNIDQDIIIDEPIGQPYSNTLIYGIDRVNGRAAKTFCSVVEHIGDKYTLVNLRLATGRTHQIRVHMSYIGHALVGDDLYGGDNSLIKRPCLHSQKIKFIQPITHELIDIAIPLADDIASVIEQVKELK